MTIIDHIDEAECFEFMVENQDIPVDQETSPRHDNGPIEAV